MIDRPLYCCTVLGVNWTMSKLADWFFIGATDIQHATRTKTSTDEAQRVCVRAHVHVRVYSITKFIDHRITFRKQIHFTWNTRQNDNFSHKLTRCRGTSKRAPFVSHYSHRAHNFVCARACFARQPLIVSKCFILKDYFAPFRQHQM